MKRIFYCSYPNYNTITHRLTRNKLCFPHLFVDSFGKSVWGKNLWVAGVGNLQSPLLVLGGVSGCDYRSVLVCFAFLEYVLKTDDPYLQEKLKQRGALVVPCLNPDGLSLWLEGAFASPDPQKMFDLCGGDVTNWQGNANGQNLYTAFGSGTCPETKALQDLCHRYTPARAACLRTDKESLFAPPNDTAGKILSFLSGWCVSPPDKSGFEAWFAKTFDRPAYGIGRTKESGPLQNFELEWQKCLSLLLALLCLPV